MLLAFIEKYGAFILSGIAIFEFWIKIIWDSFIKNGKLLFYETDIIDISYSIWGITIGLHGTVRALDNDIFISKVELKVIRKKDKAEHLMQWLAFTSPGLHYSGNEPQKTEVPYGLMISKSAPHLINIAFNDIDLANELRSHHNKYLNEWFEVCEKISEINPYYDQKVTVSQETITRQKQIVEEFKSSKTRIDYFGFLDKNCFWDKGEYELYVYFYTSKPDKKYCYEYKFQITAEENERIKFNNITILDEPINNFFKEQRASSNIVYTKIIKSNNKNTRE